MLWLLICFSLLLCRKPCHMCTVSCVLHIYVDIHITYCVHPCIHLCLFIQVHFFPYAFMIDGIHTIHKEREANREMYFDPLRKSNETLHSLCILFSLKKCKSSKKKHNKQSAISLYISSSTHTHTCGGRNKKQKNNNV